MCPPYRFVDLGYALTLLPIALQGKLLSDIGKRSIRDRISFSDMVWKLIPNAGDSLGTQILKTIINSVRSLNLKSSILVVYTLDMDVWYQASGWYDSDRKSGSAGQIAGEVSARKADGLQILI